MPDYTDWTESAELLGTEIQVPIDIQGAFIQMPVDIQGQYVTLEIDIVAQSVGNISVNLAAQSVGNIGVDIKAQTVGNVAVNIAAQAGNVTISVNAQTVGVYLQPEWAAAQGTDKEVNASGNAVASGSSIYANYTPAAGKTFYVTDISFVAYASAWANADLNQICELRLGVGTIRHSQGGVGGGSHAFSKPIRVNAGVTAYAYLYNMANHTCNLEVTMIGYEV